MSAEQPRRHEGVFEPLYQSGDRGTRRYDLVTVADLKAMVDFHSDESPVVSKGYLDLNLVGTRRQETQGFPAFRL